MSEPSPPSKTVSAAATTQRVIAVAADERIVAASTINSVVTITAVEHIIAVVAQDHRVAVRPDGVLDIGQDLCDAAVMNVARPAARSISKASDER